VLWVRLSGTQAVQPAWMVVASGLAALVVWIGVFAVIALAAIVVAARLLAPPTVHVPRIP
jgi:hypothetical protein